MEWYLFSAGSFIDHFWHREPLKDSTASISRIKSSAFLTPGRRRWNYKSTGEVEGQPVKFDSPL
ncbi:MAG: hypothetical protein BA871_12790 [Desulfuromonadales bacterium C00003096]|nr:MAG: hypothetical protein BA871_12790 [Desulfuromonadales bacterium C00003096]